MNLYLEIQDKLHTVLIQNGLKKYGTILYR